MNNDYIINETIDIFESLGSFDSLKFAYHLLDLIVDDITFNQENNQDVADYNNLTTCLLKIKEIIKNNEEKEEV